MKVIVVDEQKDNKRNKSSKNKKIEFKMGRVLEWFIYMVGYALVLYLSSKLFRGLDISSFGIALLAAIILSFLDAILKPSLIFMSIPFIVATLGIFYFFINLKIKTALDVIIGKKRFLRSISNVSILRLSEISIGFLPFEGYT